MVVSDVVIIDDKGLHRARSECGTKKSSEWDFALCGRQRSFAPAASNDYENDGTEGSQTNDSGGNCDGDLDFSAERWCVIVGGIARRGTRFRCATSQ